MTMTAKAMYEAKVAAMTAKVAGPWTVRDTTEYARVHRAYSRTSVVRLTPTAADASGVAIVAEVYRRSRPVKPTLCDYYWANEDQYDDDLRDYQRDAADYEVNRWTWTIDRPRGRSASHYVSTREAAMAAADVALGLRGWALWSEPTVIGEETA